MTAADRYRPSKIFDLVRDGGFEFDLLYPDGATSPEDIGRARLDHATGIGARSTDDNVVPTDGNGPSEIVVRRSIARDEDGLLLPSVAAQVKDVCCADLGRLIDIGGSDDGIVSIDRNRSSEIGGLVGSELGFLSPRRPSALKHMRSLIGSHNCPVSAERNGLSE